MNLITPDSGLVVWMTIIFAIVFFILAKFGFPVITSMVKKRNDKIHDSLAAARLAEEKLATLAQQQQELLEKARVEQAALLKDAAAARDNLIAQAKQQAKGSRPMQLIFTTSAEMPCSASRSAAASTSLIKTP